MSNDKDKIFLENLFNSIFQFIKEHPEESRKSLEEQGVDLDKFNSDTDELIKKLSGNAMIKLGREENSVKKLFEKAKEWMETMSFEQIKEMIGESSTEQLSFQFRNLEELDEETREMILNDAKLLKLVEYLQNK